MSGLPNKFSFNFDGEENLREITPEDITARINEFVQLVNFDIDLI